MDVVKWAEPLGARLFARAVMGFVIAKEVEPWFGLEALVSDGIIRTWSTARKAQAYARQFMDDNEYIVVHCFVDSGKPPDIESLDYARDVLVPAFNAGMKPFLASKEM